MDSRKISTRQFMLFYIVLSLAGLIRLFPTFLAARAKGHSYISVIIGAIGAVMLCLLFAYLVRNRHNQSLADLIEDVLTKPLGKVILVIYLLWSFMIFSIYIRFYAKQIVSSLLPNCQMELVIMIMLLFVYRVLKGGIMSAARLNEILFAIFTLVFATVSIATVATGFDAKNFDYFGGFDFSEIFGGSLYAFSAFAYIVFMFFMFDKVRHKGDIARLSSKAILISMLCGIAIIACTVGVIGYRASSSLEMPYFSVSKNVTIFTSVKQFEAVLYTIWMIVDYTIIMIFGYITLCIFKSVFSFENKKEFVAPIVMLGFAMSLFVGRNAFSLDKLCEHVFLYGNVILETSILPLLFIVGKIRKKI